jgi:hypothetical protein
VYAPGFEFEDKDNNMDQWELHKHGLMNAHAKSTRKELFIYSAAWKETQDRSFQPPKNNTDTDTDTDNYIDLYSDKDEENKPRALFITADMRLFQSPVFHAPVATMLSSKDRPTMPHLFQPCNAKEKSCLFK